MATPPLPPLTAPTAREVENLGLRNAKFSATVLVGCKAPNGLTLNLDHYERYGDQGQVRRIAGRAKVTLLGWAHKWGEPDLTEGGYMLTAVPADFWAEWLELNRGSSLLADKIILPPHVDAIGQAKDHASIPRMFRPAHPGDKSEDRYVAGVAVGERAA